MLAWDVARAVREALPGATLAVLARPQLDIAQPDSVRSAFQEVRPQIVFNCAAYTNVDGAETQRLAAEQANAEGVGLLAEACRASAARLIHFSTDQVFNGLSSVPYTEEDAAAPCNFYAQTKLAGEAFALSGPDNLVLRVQWLYGERKDRFTPLRTKEVFNAFEDQFGSPTWTREIAAILLPLLKRGANGLFHFAYDDYASWAQVFAFAKESWNLPVKLVPTATAAAKLPAARPRFSVLSNRKLCQALGFSGMGSWKRPLGEFLKQAQSRT
ncbi:NAD(P)-dependent oxidoreductase [bacterium]|nr:NAD(P)-dependent oxidoreductase [bacterium]